MAGSDFTAMVRDQLLDDRGAHDVRDEGQVAGDIERLLHEVQAKYPAARVYWDTELQDVVVDLSTGRGA